MDKEWKSSYDKLIRIKTHQKEWIRKNRQKHNCKTDAGFLNMIINKYKDL